MRCARGPPCCFLSPADFQTVIDRLTAVTLSRPQSMRLRVNDCAASSLPGRPFDNAQCCAPRKTVKWNRQNADSLHV